MPPVITMAQLDLPMKLPTDKPSVTLLDGTNYVSWRKAIRIYFNIKNLLPLLDVNPPADADFHVLARY